MFSMYSSRRKEARISKPYPCPECDALAMTETVESFVLPEGACVRSLKHFKCKVCGARFYVDEAMHRIQSFRTGIAASVK